MTSSVADRPKLGLHIEPLPGDAGQTIAMTPSIDGRRLDELVAEYEAARGFDVVGGYAGIVPGCFDFGPWDTYFLGAADHRYWGQVGKIAVLGCECGEIGCWPLLAAISVDVDQVTLSAFKQPHRRERDYSGLGPFSFHRRDYQAAIESATRALADADG